MRTEERRWTLVRAFYRSYQAFQALFDAYERRVEIFVESYGKDRRDIKLAPDELLSLFDPHALSTLRDNELQRLKDAAHQLFRGLDTVDPFDSFVTNIYHEVSILKEEHWTIREDVMRADRKAYDRYYREVNVYYPRRLRHVRNLYGKAKRRLESVLLPAFSRNKIMVRSVYLFGQRLVRSVYVAGLPEIYGYMYPNGGALTGYTLAADSFLDGGFSDEAAEAYGRALGVLAERMMSARESGGLPKSELAELKAQGRNLERRRDRALALD